MIWNTFQFIVSQAGLVTVLLNDRMLSYLYPSCRLFAYSFIRLFGCSFIRLFGHAYHFCLLMFVYSVIRVRLFVYSDI